MIYLFRYSFLSNFILAEEFVYFFVVDIDCGLPPGVPNANSMPKNPLTTYLSVATYVCLPGYIFQLKDSITVFTNETSSTCLLNGLWSPIAWTCLGTYELY